MGTLTKGFIYKPKLKINKLFRINQTQKLSVWKLAFKHEGNEKAKSIQVDVVEVYNEGTKRKDFLPVPLRWTHVNTESRFWADSLSGCF